MPVTSLAAPQQIASNQLQRCLSITMRQPGAALLERAMMTSRLEGDDADRTITQARRALQSCYASLSMIRASLANSPLGYLSR